jgi:hypothetical protein
LDAVDSWDNMETSKLKWKHIVKTIMAHGHFEHHSNKIGYTNKWGFLFENYKGSMTI